MSDDFFFESFQVGGGYQTRLAIQDCGGNWIQKSDVSRIEYTIFQRNYDERAAIETHSNVSVDSSSILDEPETDPHTSRQFNFKHTISQAGGNPFPEYGSVYVIQYRFFDTKGIAHVHEIEGVTPN